MLSLQITWFVIIISDWILHTQPGPWQWPSPFHENRYQKDCHLILESEAMYLEDAVPYVINKRIHRTCITNE